MNIRTRTTPPLFTPRRRRIADALRRVIQRLPTTLEDRQATRHTSVRRRRWPRTLHEAYDAHEAGRLDFRDVTPGKLGHLADIRYAITIDGQTRRAQLDSSGNRLAYLD